MRDFCLELSKLKVLKMLDLQTKSIPSIFLKYCFRFSPTTLRPTLCFIPPVVGFVFFRDLRTTFQPVHYSRLPFGILIHIANSSTIVVLATIRNLHFPILLGAKIL
jgi:hypothetical protein